MTKRPKPCANVRRLAKLRAAHFPILIDEAGATRAVCDCEWESAAYVDCEDAITEWAAHAAREDARHGVLAVSAETVPNAYTPRLVSYYPGHIRSGLRRLARGEKR